MVDPAGNPVRLDPWQNIVGVGWDGDEPEPPVEPPGPPVVAPSVRATATKTDVAGSYADITVTVPAHVDGDLLIAQIARSGDTGDDITAPAGWTAIFENLWVAEENAFGDCVPFGAKMSMFRRTASSEPADYTWTYDNTNSVRRVGGIASIKDADPTTPIEAFDTDTSTACGPGPGTPPRTLDIGNVSSTTDKTLVLVGFAVTETFMPSGAPLDPVGFTWGKQWDLFTGPVTQSVQLQLHTKKFPTAGPIGPLTHADLLPGEIPSIVNATIVISGVPT